MIDYLIIGQGLAGSILSYFLKKLNQKIIIIDNKHSLSASMLSAGTMNYVLGQRLAMPADAITIIPYALNFYKEIEKHSKKIMITNKPFIKIFNNIHEKEWYKKRILQDQYQPFIGKTIQPNEIKNIKNPNGGCYINKTYQLDTPSFLNWFQQQLLKNNELIFDKLNIKDLNITPQWIKWKTIKTKHIIFCDGQNIRFNPMFKNIPFYPSQGDVLTINSTQLDPNKIINHGKWLTPIAKNYYRYGATYLWQNINCMPSQIGYNELIQSLKKLTSANFNILNHSSGIRMIPSDKMPILGTHPLNQNIHIFNGFGSRGTISIPYFANFLANHLVKKIPLSKTINFKRFQ
ncbi:hypothetical protein DID75_05005 [Candidatus Marinamargulisbacteria bacterium SCGC AG-410-N11]|nr:hypothetical protein DID75_05005 [Candidatus Marinamargulisbacteria bacterium SCGC AG-410-N11]